LQLKLSKDTIIDQDIYLSVTCKEILPQYTAHDLNNMNINGIISHYTTNFDPNKLNHVQNISLSANAFNDLFIAPKQEVSFNEVVGPRSLKAGYKVADIIINNQLVEGIGGGVCQVATTLYNAFC